MYKVPPGLPHVRLGRHVLKRKSPGNTIAQSPRTPSTHILTPTCHALTATCIEFEQPNIGTGSALNVHDCSSFPG